MRPSFMLLLAACLATSPAWSETTDNAATVEVPEPPAIPENYTPPPPSDQPLEEMEPEVTIVPKKEAVFEEYRINGRLYMVKVTPTRGPAYYLIDRQGQGNFERSDLEPKIAIPSWVIKRF